MRPRLSSQRDGIFVDTSAYFALTSPRDGNHEAAGRIAARLTIEHWRFFTTNFILAETHALLLNRLGRVIALGAVSAIMTSATTIVRVSPDDEQRAWEIVRRYDDKTFSFTDASSFVVMERLQLTRVFSFDADFAQYGFLALNG